MFIHVFCKNFWVPLSFIERNRFLFLIWGIVLYYIIAFLSLREKLIFLLNLLCFNIFCLKHFLFSFTSKTLIFLLYTHSIALLLATFRHWVLFIFRCASCQSFSCESIFVDSFIFVIVGLKTRKLFKNAFTEAVFQLIFFLIVRDKIINKGSIIFQR